MSAPIINTRSPYYLKVVDEDTVKTLSSVTMQIEVYEGVQGDATGTPTYTLTKDATSATINYAVFEISELIRDYLYTNYYDASVDCLWVKVTATGVDASDASVDVGIDLGEEGIVTTAYLIAIDGFGNFNEGANPRTSSNPLEDTYTPMLLQNTRKLYFIKGKEMKLPIYAVPEPTISFSSGLSSVSITDNGNSNQKIQYLTISAGATNVFTTGDTITLTSTVGETQTQSLELVELCDLKYNPIKVFFYNRFGAIEEMWLNKKSVNSMTVSSEQYKTSVFDYGTLTYDVNRHSNKKFSVQGKERISASSGYLSQDINPSFKEMLLSENVWIMLDTSASDGQTWTQVNTYWGETPRLWLEEDDIIPVTVATSDITEKTSVNDKLIAYTFEFEYAFDKIQNIR